MSKKERLKGLPEYLEFVYVSHSIASANNMEEEPMNAIKQIILELEVQDPFWIVKQKTNHMISCYELRLGNRVLVDKNLQQVSMITGTAVFTSDAGESHGQAASEHRFEQVEPVPLTDDVLKQCGFVYHDYFKFWQLITTGTRSEMDIDSDYDVIDFMRKPIIKNLASLHQLQNVYFMLKGKELTLYKTTVATG
jgi:hypothetical protein